MKFLTMKFLKYFFLLFLFFLTFNNVAAYTIGDHNGWEGPGNNILTINYNINNPGEPAENIVPDEAKRYIVHDIETLSSDGIPIVTQNPESVFNKWFEDVDFNIFYYEELPSGTTIDHLITFDFGVCPDIMGSTQEVCSNIDYNPDGTLHHLQIIFSNTTLWYYGPIHTTIPGTVNFQQRLMKIFGEAIGLGPSIVPDALMYLGSNKVDLNIDDKCGVKAIYLSYFSGCNFDWVNSSITDTSRGVFNQSRRVGIGTNGIATISRNQDAFDSATFLLKSTRNIYYEIEDGWESSFLTDEDGNISFHPSSFVRLEAPKHIIEAKQDVYGKSTYIGINVEGIDVPVGYGQNIIFGGETQIGRDTRIFDNLGNIRIVSEVKEGSRGHIVFSDIPEVRNNYAVIDGITGNIGIGNFTLDELTDELLQLEHGIEIEGDIKSDGNLVIGDSLRFDEYANLIFSTNLYFKDGLVVGKILDERGNLDYDFFSGPNFKTAFSLEKSSMLLDPTSKIYLGSSNATIFTQPKFVDRTTPKKRQSLIMTTGEEPLGPDYVARQKKLVMTPLYQCMGDCGYYQTIP